MTRRSTTIAALACVLGLAPACGISTEDAPTKLAENQVSIDAPSTTTSLPVDTPRQPAPVCLVEDDHLTTLVVELAAPVSAADALDGLIETSSTALPPGTRSLITRPGLVTSQPTTRGVARVELKAPFLEIAPADQILAIAQIVCTLTGVPGIGQVQFFQNGEPTNVPRADSSLRSRPLSRDDYASLMPENG